MPAHAVEGVGTCKTARRTGGRTDTVNLATGTATGVGVSATGGLIGIEAVIGGTGTDTLTGPTPRVRGRSPGPTPGPSTGSRSPALKN